MRAIIKERIFGVGFVGVTAGAGWASTAHVPALRAQPENFHIAGIANTHAASAQAAALALNVAQAFDDYDRLLASSAVDIVAVTVKVPAHYHLVAKALKAGKHVYCEWPLGNGLDEARRLAALARETGMHAVIGTQARVAPAILHARDLIAQGYVGEVLSSTVIGSGGNWGSEIAQRNAYSLDVSNGASMLTIPFGHMMAALVDLLGDVVSVSAELAVRRSAVRIVETGAFVPMTSPDQVIVAATLEGGKTLAVHYRGGQPKGPGLLWEISGTEGALEITAPSGHVQMAQLSLRGARGGDPLSPLILPPGHAMTNSLAGPACNVARVYERLAHDLRHDSRTAPTFEDAVKTHRLIEAIEISAREGRRVSMREIDER